MEAPSAEAPERPVVHHQNHGDQTFPDSLPREDGKLKAEAIEEVKDREEVRGVLHDWDKLKTMLSFQLKQVLSEYPDAKMNGEEQHASFSETFAELVSRLDQGPPFTLQRLCEILLTARTIYANLPKLALAREKNLSVSSTLTVCTDPYPQTLQRPDASEKLSEESQLPFVLVENGVEPVEADRDETMAKVEEGDIDDSMTIDMVAFEDIVAPSDANSIPTGNSRGKSSLID